VLYTNSVPVPKDGRFDTLSVEPDSSVFTASRPSQSLDYLKHDIPETRLYMNGWKVRRRLSAFRSFVTGNKASLRDQWGKLFKDYRPRGIVISAGGRRPLLNSFVAVSILRNTLGCQLPIILTHYGEQEMSNKSKTVFEEQIGDIEFLDLEKAMEQWPPHQLPLEFSDSQSNEQGYKLKIWSIFLAPFQQVLYLDADNTPIMDPSELFDIEPFKKHGSLFW
jgi:hypothetical protein